MREVHWEMMVSTLPHVVLNIVALSLVLTIFGTFVMRYFVRDVPLKSHAIIFFWAVFRVLLVAMVVTVIAVIFGISPGPLSAASSILVLFAVAGSSLGTLQETTARPLNFRLLAQR